MRVRVWTTSATAAPTAGQPAGKRARLGGAGATRALAARGAGQRPCTAGGGPAARASEPGSAGGGRTFLLFLMVTRVTPGTGFMPSFIIALRLFFSLRLCLEPASPPAARTARQQGRQAARNAGCRRGVAATARRCAGARRSAACSARRGAPHPQWHRRALARRHRTSPLRHRPPPRQPRAVPARRGCQASAAALVAALGEPASSSPKALPLSVAAAFATRLAPPRTRRSKRAPRPWRPASWSTESVQIWTLPRGAGTDACLLALAASARRLRSPSPPPVRRIGAHRAARHVQGGCQCRAVSKGGALRLRLAVAVADRRVAARRSGLA